MVEPATAAAEAEAGVLRSLLEEEEDPPGDVSLMANDTATGQLDVNTIVAQQHAAAHQARAAAALEQADAEERHHQDQQHHQQQQHQQYHHHGDETSQQLQHQVTMASTPPPIITQVSAVGPQSPTQTDLENEVSLTPGPPDLTLSAVPPPSICLCQQPARIPRPRNGETPGFIQCCLHFLFFIRDCIVSLSFFFSLSQFVTGGVDYRITGFSLSMN